MEWRRIVLNLELLLSERTHQCGHCGTVLDRDHLLPWAKTRGFDQVMGNRLAVRNSRFTGRIVGQNCYEAEKAKRLQAELGDLSQYCIYAYGDSSGDRELTPLSTLGQASATRIILEMLYMCFTKAFLSREIGYLAIIMQIFLIFGLNSPK